MLEGGPLDHATTAVSGAWERSVRWGRVLHQVVYITDALGELVGFLVVAGGGGAHSKGYCSGYIYKCN